MDIKLFQLETKLMHKFGEDRIYQNEMLAKHCNWRVGGPADLFFIAQNSYELIQAVRMAKMFRQPVTILGFGANVLVSDRGVYGLVILNRAQRIEYLENNIIETDSGTNLVTLAKHSAKSGIGGLEFLIGIPGTVGAAVAVNAGTRTEWISTVVEKVLIINKRSQLEWVSPTDLDFSYRNSKLKQSGEIVITVRLQGKTDATENIEQKMAEFLKVRKSQPTGPSTGSVFTNPPDDFAGRLIEAAGLKGYQIGGAQVSEMHANFILNVGNAKAIDMKSVIEHVKATVAQKFGIHLEEEIRYLGRW